MITPMVCTAWSPYIVARLIDPDLMTVYLGYVGWSAGAFSQSYELSLTPVQQNGQWSDTSLVSSCLKPQ